MHSIYYLNNNNEATIQKTFDSGGNYTGDIIYTWEDGNCVKVLYYNQDEWNFEYANSIKNPYYNQNKYLKKSFLGSCNFYTTGDFISYDYEQFVLSTNNEYPIVSELYKSGEFYRTFNHEYYELSNVNEWMMEKDYEILDIKYYNFLGQEIEKPQKSFYIERKLTDKGIISKKHFIP